MFFETLHGVGRGVSLGLELWRQVNLTRCGAHIHSVLIILLVIRVLASHVFVAVVIILSHLLCDLGWCAGD